MIEQGSLWQETNWIPRDLKSLLSLYWEELPRGVRDVLVIAALAGNVFPNSPVLEAAEATGVENAADLLGRSHQPFGYVKPVSEIIHWFTDPIFHKVAFEEANELLTPSEVAQVHEALSSFAQGIDPDDPAAEIAWRIHVELADQGNTDTSEAASSAIKLAEFLARFDFAGAHNARSGRSGTPKEHIKTTSVLGWFVSSCLQRAAATRKQSTRRRVCWQTSKRRSVTTTPTLRLRNDVALVISDAGRVDDAIAAFEELWLTYFGCSAVTTPTRSLLGPTSPGR